MNPADFQVIKMQPGEGLNLSPENFGGQLAPLRLWILPHGSVKNKPSFIFEMIEPMTGLVFIAQISDKTLSEALCQADAMKILSEQ